MSPSKIQITIVVDNPAVLLSLSKARLQGDQALITEITEATNQLQEMGSRSVCGSPHKKTLSTPHGHMALWRSHQRPRAGGDPPEAPFTGVGEAISNCRGCPPKATGKTPHVT